VTALRAQLGRVPHAFYLECLQLYRELPDRIEMAFGPIGEIGPTPENVSIVGWEALARTAEDSTRAPTSILRAAEARGPEFIVERDKVLAVRAIRSYRAAYQPWIHTIRPLSINVAVPALLGDTYTEAVGSAIRHTSLGRHRVTLEISERDAIAPAPGRRLGSNAPR
jgi:EAL domain-containing protein (putative c-di-GMP-specific phosphodiesterase class I)